MSIDYGASARLGVATPQSNPTVEPELQALLPSGVALYATRLVHPAPELESRLEHYIRHLPQAIATFGSLRLAAFGLGCTGSSYRVSPTEEDALTAAAAASSGLPVVTAAQAIRRALAALGARRIALLSPYPANLAEAGYRYWEAAGLGLVGRRRVDPALIDSHGIYEMTSADALAALRGLDCRGADAVVLSGTGMPTLRALHAARSELPMPVVSSNLCLAWALWQAALPARAPATPGEMLQAAGARIF